MSKLAKLIATLAASFAVQSASAVVLTHGTDGVFDGGGSWSSDFDRAEFMFASEYADTITISNFGFGYAHDHGSEAQAEVEVYNGSNWITVFSASLAGEPSLSTLFSNPITFTGMNISGLRLDGSSYVGNLYHGVNSEMTYTTSGVANAVPEPTTVALLGLGLLGFAASRRKAAKK